MTKSKKVRIQTQEEAPELEVESGQEIDDSASKGEGEKNTAGSEASDELGAARQEARDHYDRLLRVSAEFENYKKRSAKEISDFRKYANESLIKDLLPVVDNLERAIASARDEKEIGESFLEGIEMTRKELLRVFEKFGVKAIEAVGEEFDPRFHQAVMQEESEDHPENIVTSELSRGYTIQERLLRPTMVVVSKGNPAGSGG